MEIGDFVQVGHREVKTAQILGFYNYDESPAIKLMSSENATHLLAQDVVEPRRQYFVKVGDAYFWRAPNMNNPCIAVVVKDLCMKWSRKYCSDSAVMPGCPEKDVL